MKSSDLAIVLIKKIPYFTAGEIKSKGKFHISIGHQTGIGIITLFSCPLILGDQSTPSLNKSNLIARGG